MNQPTCVFVYGLLLPVVPIRNSIGTLKNFKFYPLHYANITRTESSEDSVRGILLKVTAHDLKQLDQMENYPNFYTRTIETITLDDGTHRQAWVYHMLPEWYDQMLVDKEPYLSHCVYDRLRDLYQTNDLPLTQLTNSVSARRRYYLQESEKLNA